MHALEEQSGAHSGFWDVLGSRGPIKGASEGEQLAERQIQRGSGKKRLFRYDHINNVCDPISLVIIHR